MSTNFPRKVNTARPMTTRERIAKGKAQTSPTRCEGWRRYGGAFSLGPVKWEQCKEPATVMLKLKQDGKVQTLPGCVTCWAEAMNKGIEILEAKPI